jgi:hypothetical protein
MNICHFAPPTTATFASDVAAASSYANVSPTEYILGRFFGLWGRLARLLNAARMASASSGSTASSSTRPFSDFTKAIT